MAGHPVTPICRLEVGLGMRRNYKNILNIIVGVALCAAPVALLPLTASAQVCEYPLPIRLNIPEGNVLFLLDSSDSMNEVVYHDNYDAFTVYAGPFDPAVTYLVKFEATYSPYDFADSLATTPTAYLVDSDGAEAGRYNGNYLNWVYYHAIKPERDSLPTITRIQAAKAVILTTLFEHDNIRFGVYKHHAGGEGGVLISKIGSPRFDIINQVNGVVARGPSPTAETLVDIKTYFEDPSATLGPIQYECQKSFVVILSDGYPTRDQNIPAYIGDWDGDGNEPGTCTSIGSPDPDTQNCTDYMDDVAGYMSTHDHRIDLDGPQNVFTYVVGFTIDAPLLQDTATNGNGLFLTANNMEQLQSALKSVLLDIILRMSAGSAVSLAPSDTQQGARLFRTKYFPGGWQGFVEAFDWPFTEPDPKPLWEAGALLKDIDPALRTIYTSVTGTPVEFTEVNTDALYASMGTPQGQATSEVINWTRGDEVKNGTKPYRSHNKWLLGDVVDSSPVVVGAPASFSFDPDHATFVLAWENRREMVYFGANDAMLHALDGATGVEQWAYIPETQLPKLASIADSAYCHLYSVNLTPRIKDLKINGAWKTVLFGGMREGGDGYFALDVTDPDNADLLWDIDLPGLNGSWSDPVFANVPWSSNPVMIVGSGPDDTTFRSLVVMLDTGDGSVLWGNQLNVHTEINMSSSPAIVDFDLDGLTDVAYLNDLSGKVWRVDLSAFPPTVSLLFDNDQPIMAPPVLTVDYNNDVFLFFGTGRYLDTPDFLDTSQQTFYALFDDHSLTTLTRNDLVDQTTTISAITNADKGWFVDLVQGPRERVAETAAIVAEIVYVTSFAPAGTLCKAGGFSWLYSFKFRNGAGYDGDDDDYNDTTDNRVEDIGEGISSNPVVDIDNEEVIVQDSDSNIHIKDAKGDIQILVVRSWRQRYN